MARDTYKYHFKKGNKIGIIYLFTQEPNFVGRQPFRPSLAPPPAS